MQVSDFDYDLPERLIAQFPPEVYAAAAACCMSRARNGRMVFSAICQSCCKAGDLLVFNDTRVIKARIFGQKASGGQIEALIERVLDQHTALALRRASKAPKPGTHDLCRSMAGRDG